MPSYTFFVLLSYLITFSPMLIYFVYVLLAYSQKKVELEQYYKEKNSFKFETLEDEY